MLPTGLYYAADLVIGFGVPLGLTLWRAPAARPWRRYFWLGAALGLCLEVPVFASAMFASQPLMGFLTPPPLPVPVYFVSHTLWDGSLFCAGILGVRLAFGPAALSPRRGRTLAGLVLWGQISALAVEVSSVTSGAWSYVSPHPWNLTLFEVAGHPITLIPQLAWLVLPGVFWWGVGRSPSTSALV